MQNFPHLLASFFPFSAFSAIIPPIFRQKSRKQIGYFRNNECLNKNKIMILRALGFYTA